MEVLSEQRSFDGTQYVIRHPALSTQCDMVFSLFLPPGEGPFPVLWYLSGLTCTHANVTEKGEFRRVAAELGIAIVCPDTSPRGKDLPGAHEDDWELGTGAGYYIDATQEPYLHQFRMYTYVTQELPERLLDHYPLDPDRQSIFGHSMGGHGALICALKNPGHYRSCSAFAPITHPSTATRAKKAFVAYLGADAHSWREWDSVSLIEDGAQISELLVDQGEEDEFLDSSMRPWLLKEVCERRGINLNLRMQPGYDHSYYFVSTFMEDHLRWHARYLNR